MHAGFSARDLPVERIALRAQPVELALSFAEPVIGLVKVLVTRDVRRAKIPRPLELAGSRLHMVRPHRDLRFDRRA